MWAPPALQRRGGDWEGPRPAASRPAGEGGAPAPHTALLARGVAAPTTAAGPLASPGVAAALPQRLATSRIPGGRQGTPPPQGHPGAPHPGGLSRSLPLPPHHENKAICSRSRDKPTHILRCTLLAGPGIRPSPSMPGRAPGCWGQNLCYFTGRAPRNPEWTPRAAVPAPLREAHPQHSGVARAPRGGAPAARPQSSSASPAGPNTQWVPGVSHEPPVTQGPCFSAWCCSLPGRWAGTTRSRTAPRPVASAPGAGGHRPPLPGHPEGGVQQPPGVPTPRPATGGTGPRRGLALIPASVPSRPAPHAASGSWFRCPMHTHCPGRPGVGLGSVPRPRGAAESGGRCQAPAGAAGTGAAGSLPGTQGAHGSPRLLTHALQGGARPRPPEQTCRAGQRPLKGVGA